jgi:DinB superfamily
MDPKRRFWNQQQQALRAALLHPGDGRKAFDLFLDQHGMVHSSRMAPAAGFSFDDDLWRDLSEKAARYIPPKGEHSIAWMIWHIARIEDVTMNILVAGSRQVFEDVRRQENLGVAIPDTGNAMTGIEIAQLSATIDLEALKAYRLAVGCRTREIILQLRVEELKRKTDPMRLQRVKESGAVGTAASWLLDYWGGLTLAGILLMPPTRHNFVHLTEAARGKVKAKKVYK